LQSLHYIKRASNLQVWLEKDKGSAVGVIAVDNFTTSYTSGKQGFEFTINIEFPKNFDFYNAKQY